MVLTQRHPQVIELIEVVFVLFLRIFKIIRSKHNGLPAYHPVAFRRIADNGGFLSPIDRKITVILGGLLMLHLHFAHQVDKPTGIVLNHFFHIGRETGGHREFQLSSQGKRKKGKNRN